MILQPIEINISKAEFTISKINNIDYKSNIGNFAKHLKAYNLSIYQYTEKYHVDLLPKCLESGEHTDNKLTGYWNKYTPLKKEFKHLQRYVKTTSTILDRIKNTQPEYWCDELSFEYWLNLGYTLNQTLTKLRFFVENRDISYYTRLSINSPYYDDWAMEKILEYKTSVISMTPINLKNKWTKEGVLQRGINQETVNSFYKNRPTIFREVKHQTELSLRAHIKYPNWKLNSIRCIDFWVKKGYSSEYAIDIIHKIQKLNSVETISNRLNCTIDEAKLIQNSIYARRINTMNNKSDKELELIHSKQDSSSFKYCLRKCNDDIEAAEQLFLELKKRRTVPFGVASKESLRYFIPLYKKLRNMGLKRESLYFGVNGSREYFISYNNLFFMYDFTILNKKLIIEYDGAYWHKNTQEYDTVKDNAAIANGFKILRISSNDDVNTNNNKITQFINENI